MVTTSQILIRLLVSIGLSSLIGFERETIKRPAGFRTHILVCVGSTLVMLVSLYIFDLFKHQANIQPDRLGAQVISGIGFLGAGTIIREGSSVKGLTTAAGLWATACIGLAVGVGFYLGAILTTALVFVTLYLFSKVEKHIKSRRNYVNIKIYSINKPGQLGEIGKALGCLGVDITNINLEHEEDDTIIIRMLVKVPDSIMEFDIIRELKKIEGVFEVSQKN